MSYRNAPPDAPKIALSVQFDAACPRCGYNLRGLKMDRSCPECGHHVSHLFAKPVSIATANLAEMMTILPTRLLVGLAMLGMVYSWTHPVVALILPRESGVVSLVVAGVLAGVFMQRVNALRGEIEMSVGTLAIERSIGWWTVGIVASLGLLVLAATDPFLPVAGPMFLGASLAAAAFASILGGQAVNSHLREHGIPPETVGPWVFIPAFLFLLAAGLPSERWLAMHWTVLAAVRIVALLSGIGLVGAGRVLLFNPLRRAQGSVMSLNRKRR